MGRTIYWLSITALVVLGIVEVTTRYDEWSRQLALVVTDVVVIIVLLFLRPAFRGESAALLGVMGVAAFLGVGFDAAGNFAGLYGKILWWDRVAHGFGAGAATVACSAVIIRQELIGRIKLTSFLHVVMAVSLGMLMAGLYEISELIGDELFDLHRITDFYDTADDLRWNLIAAIPAACIMVGLAKRLRLVG